jgi:hypothetical protein
MGLEAFHISEGLHAARFTTDNFRVIQLDWTIRIETSTYKIVTAKQLLMQ